MMINMMSVCGKARARAVRVSTFKTIYDFDVSKLVGRTRMTEAHAAMRNALFSATGSSSFSSSARKSSSEVGSSDMAVDSRFFSSSEPSAECSTGESGSGLCAGLLMARVASKSKFSGHYKAAINTSTGALLCWETRLTISETTVVTIPPTPIEARLPASISRSPPVVCKAT